MTLLHQFESSIKPLSSTQQGILVACILLPASISSLFSGYVSDKISRKYAILCGALMTLVGTIISAVSFSLGALFAARMITGAGIGLALAVATVYLVEIAPSKTRGAWASLLQLHVVLGVMLGYFVVFASRNVSGSLAWRIPFIVQSGNAMILAGGSMIIPFSPRWLVQKDRIADAQKCLELLRDSSMVEQELGDIPRSFSKGTQAPGVAFGEMFKPRYLRRTLLGIFIMIRLQMNGVSTICFL